MLANSRDDTNPYVWGAWLIYISMYTYLDDVRNVSLFIAMSEISAAHRTVLVSVYSKRILPIDQMCRQLTVVVTVTVNGCRSVRYVGHSSRNPPF